MGKDKKSAKKIQDYYHLSLNYLESARISLKKELFEPAMFSAILTSSKAKAVTT